jgi:excisionase family DNA binding protein
VSVVKPLAGVSPKFPVYLLYQQHHLALFSLQYLRRWREAGADGVQIESRKMNDESKSAESAPGGVTPLASNLQAGKFLTVAEVAAILRLSKMSVYRLIHSGQLEAVQFGRSFRVTEKALNTYLDNAYFSAG